MIRKRGQTNIAVWKTLPLETLLEAWIAFAVRAMSRAGAEI